MKRPARGMKVDGDANNLDDELFWAVYDGNVEKARELVLLGADVHQRTAKKATLLFEAAVDSPPEMALFLIEQGVRPFARDDDGTPAISAFASNGCLQVVGRLLDLGESVHAEDAKGICPLIAAAAEFRTEVVKLLLERGANPLSTCLDGASALHHAGDQAGASLAKLESSVEVVDVLVAAGTSVNGVDKTGATPLHRMVRRANAHALVKRVLDLGADPNIRDSQGRTPLVIVASEKSVDVAMAMLLLEAGADSTIKSTRGASAVSLSKTRPGLAQLLEARRAQEAILRVARPSVRPGQMA